jgi:hypothetical protein
MNPKEVQPDALRAFEEIDRKWKANNRGPDPIGFWPQAVCYAIGLILTVGWISMDLWTGKCGTPFAGRASICSLFGSIALAVSLWTGFSRHNWSAAARFLISGAVPLAGPFLIALVRGFD